MTISHTNSRGPPCSEGLCLRILGTNSQTRARSSCCVDFLEPSPFLLSGTGCLSRWVVGPLQVMKLFVGSFSCSETCMGRTQPSLIFFRISHPLPNVEHKVGFSLSPSPLFTSCTGLGTTTAVCSGLHPTSPVSLRVLFLR